MWFSFATFVNCNVYFEKPFCDTKYILQLLTLRGPTDHSDDRHLILKGEYI
jgi:hypothetical protein